MEQKNKALDSALGSTSIEGVQLHPEVLEMLQEALQRGTHDKSFLYELNQLIKEKEQNEPRKK